MKTDIDYRKEITPLQFRSRLWINDNLSDLAKATLPREEYLQKDPDIFLCRCVIDFWIEDILERKNEISTELYNTAQELKTLYYDHDHYILDHERENRIDDLVQEVIILIINTNYSPYRKHIDMFIQDPDKDEYPYGEHPSIEQRLANKTEEYMLMVLLYPADNLVEYFHDYLSYTGEYLKDRYIQQILDERLLLKYHKDPQIYHYVIKKIVSLFDE